MNFLEQFYPEASFGGFSDIDGTIAFYTRVNANLHPTMTVLDVGCGRGASIVDDPVAYRRNLLNLRGKCRKVIGLDVDPDAEQNPGVDEFHLIDDLAAWPVADASIDLVVSDFVLEHIEQPNYYFSEVVRVLKPGGLFFARTTNRIGYVGLIASIIPNRRHAQVVQAAQQDRKEIDVFPTRYKVNTVWNVRQALKKAGLRGVAYGYEAEPSYLNFSILTYVFGKYLHALTPSFLRNSLFVIARKPIETSF